MSNYNLEKRRYVIAFVATAIVVVYIVRLFTLQLLSDDYKKNADSNAFLKKIEYPSRGAIYDRNGRLLVYNQPAYDIMVVMNEAKGRIDTLEFCHALGITKEFFIKRMNDIKDYSKNPGYSRFTQQLFMSQLPSEEFSFFQEKILRRIATISLATTSANSVWRSRTRNSCVAKKECKFCCATLADAYKASTWTASTIANRLPAKTSRSPSTRSYKHWANVSWRAR